MAITEAKFYGGFFQSLCNKEIDLDTDVIKLMWTTVTYVPNQDTHRYKSSVTNEVSGSGYTAGGATVGSMAVTYDGATNVLKIDGADVSWATVTFTGGRVGVLYDSTPASDATRPLIGYIVSDTDISPSAGPVNVTWDAGGIATVTVA